MSNPYRVFNKLILFTAESYLTNAIDEGLSAEPLHKSIVSGIRAYMSMGRFSKEEAKLMIKLGEHECIQNLTKTEISFVVYALELMKLYVDNVPREYRKSIHLGVSNSKLKMGRATFAVSMLKLKQRDIKQYNETKDIIDQSVLTAKKFFLYCEDEIVNKKGKEI